MRLVTYRGQGAARSGVSSDGRVHDAAQLAQQAGIDPASVATVRRILEAGDETQAALAAEATRAGSRGEGTPLADVELGAPVEDPDKIICLGLNYRDHAEESGLTPPPAPMLFAKYRNSLAGAHDAVVVPAITQACDYEGELAVVIGRTAKDVPEAEALTYVAGVMALNDVTARDVQHATSQWLAGKAIDTFAPCGPELVLLDEIDDVQDLAVRTRVNGVTVQDGTTADQLFGVAETVAFVSSLMTLVPGDVIATGTPAGVGISRDPQVLLTDGDLVEVEIEGVGTLRNPVVSAPVAATGAPAGAVA